jgi:hypothetical protein
MRKIEDSVFGTMKFDASWWRPETVTFLNREWDVTMRVEGNDAQESILPEQRDAFTYFLENGDLIATQMAKALFDYYTDIAPDLRAQLGATASNAVPEIHAPSGLSALVEITMLMFPLVLEPGERRIGFMGSCAWDPEHGIALVYADGEIEVGGQDLLT